MQPSCSVVFVFGGAPELRRWHGCGCSLVTAAALRALDESPALAPCMVPKGSASPATYVPVSCSLPLLVLEGSCLRARRPPACRSQQWRPCATTCAFGPGAHVTRVVFPLLVLHVRAQASPWQPANKSLQRILVNVAKIHDHKYVSRVARLVLCS